MSTGQGTRPESGDDLKVVPRTASAERHECSALDEVLRVALYARVDQSDGYVIAESAYFALCEYQSATS